MLPIYIYGTGGHGRVILDILQRHPYPIAAFIDDRPPEGLPLLHHIPILTTPTLGPGQCQWIIAIGHNPTRQAIATRLSQQGHQFTTVIHPSAQIGSRVAIGPGTVIMANTAINCDTQIGAHVIINTGSTIDHDCTIGDYSHIAPGSTLSGHVKVGPGFTLPVGSKVGVGVDVGE